MQLKHCNNKPSSCNITAAYYIMRNITLVESLLIVLHTHTHTHVLDPLREIEGIVLQDSMLVVALGQLGNQDKSVSTRQRLQKCFIACDVVNDVHMVSLKLNRLPLPTTPLCARIKGAGLFTLQTKRQSRKRNIQHQLW